MERILTLKQLPLTPKQPTPRVVTTPAFHSPAVFVIRVLGIVTGLIWGGGEGEGRAHRISLSDGPASDGDN